MTTGRFLFFFLAFLCSLPAFAQPVTFQATYGLNPMPAYGSLTNVVATADGGYILPAAIPDPVTNGIVNVNLIKTDNLGAMQWCKQLAANSQLAMFTSNVNASVIQTSDGGYATEMLISGATSSDDPSLLVFRLDASGNVLWERGFVNSFLLSSQIMQASDGGFLVTGTMNSNPSSFSGDFWMAKLDATGSFLWSKKYDMAGSEFLNSAFYTSDGGVIMAGTSGGMNVMKTDGSGNVQWAYLFVSGMDDCPMQVIQASTGDYVLAGRSSNNQTGGLWDIFTMKLNASGGIVWGYYYGGNSFDEGYGVVEAADGGFVFACEPESFIGTSEGCLMKTDVNGNFLWMKTYTVGGVVNFPSAVTIASDGGFVLTGVHDAFSAASAPLYLNKTDSDGNTDCEFQSVTPTRTNYSPTVTSTFTVSPDTNSVVQNHSWTTQSIAAVSYVCGNGPPEPPPVAVDSLFIPNVFTPNGSTINDEFEIIYTGSENYHLWIYDRWGILMYETEDKTKYWNGNSKNGNPATDGTYYYILKIGEKPYTGFLTLLR